MHRKDDTMNSDNLRILNALKAIADKLGADDKANVSENENGRIAEELERIAMIKDLKPEPSGGGGGSGSGFLKVGVDAETNTLDKTWQEIFDAVGDGWHVSMTYSEDGYASQAAIKEVLIDGDNYDVYVPDEGVAYTIMIYRTDSADGYPVLNQDGVSPH